MPDVIPLSQLQLRKSALGYNYSKKQLHCIRPFEHINWSRLLAVQAVVVVRMIRFSRHQQQTLYWRGEKNFFISFWLNSVQNINNFQVSDVFVGIVAARKREFNFASLESSRTWVSNWFQLTTCGCLYISWPPSPAARMLFNCCQQIAPFHQTFRIMNLMTGMAKATSETAI